MDRYDFGKMTPGQLEKYRAFITADAEVQSHIHAGLRSAPVNNKSQMRWYHRTTNELQDIRDKAREEWLAIAPEPMGRNDKLIATANGHEDNPSVQAARRLCDKHGLDWQSTELETA